MTRERLLYNLCTLALAVAILALPAGILLAFATGYWQWLTLPAFASLFLYHLLHS